MKLENIQRYASEKSKFIIKKKFRTLLGLTAFVMIPNSISLYFGMLHAFFWVWLIGLLVFLCWTIAFISKVEKSYRNDVLYEGIALSMQGLAVVSLGIKVQLIWGYVSSAIILPLAAGIVMLNVFAAINSTRRMLSKDTYVSQHTGSKEPDAIFVFVGGSIVSGIVSAYFTQDAQNTIFFAGLIFISSLFLYFGCRYCYKAYLLKKYSADIEIENQPEEVKLADRLDDRGK